MENILADYAPIIVLIFIAILQYKILPTFADLEKKHREILDNVDKKFVSWTVFKTLQIEVEGVKDTVEKIYEILISKKED